jgi:hypothetical protein
MGIRGAQWLLFDASQNDDDLSIAALKFVDHVDILDLRLNFWIHFILCAE